MALALLADIGGTNTRVAVADGTTVLTDSQKSYENRRYAESGKDIGHILADYLAQTGASVGAVCVAAAGPVEDGVATMTNLNWVMDAAKLSKATGAGRVAILNDLQAQGFALGHIAEDKLKLVMPGPRDAGKAMLVVGLGTGVNAAPVHPSGRGRIVPPSECGHVNMPVRNEEDLRLVRFVETLPVPEGKGAHCGVEEVLAGRGLVNVHAFAGLAAGLGGTKTTKEIFADLAAGDPVANHAGAIYTRILAQMLADLALIHLPYGGIYLIGGMARAMAPHLQRFGLEQGFRENRRVDLLTREFSIRVVEDDFAALTGCAAHLAE